MRFERESLRGSSSDVWDEHAPWAVSDSNWKLLSEQAGLNELKTQFVYDYLEICNLLTTEWTEKT
jgi:hypothetical protein